MRAALAQRLGRRGAFLVLAGLLWTFQAVAIAQAPPSTDPGVQSLLHEQIPVWLRCALWAGTGLLALGFAWRRSPGGDTPGFIAPIVMPLERAVSFLYGYALHMIPGPPPGYERGLIDGAAWAAVSAAIIVIAGWPEPEGYAPPRKAPR